MAKKTNIHGLGRGLDALLGEDELEAVARPAQDKTTDGAVERVKIRDIDVNRDQPRKDFDEAALGELADSIRAVGVLQPIIASRNGSRYTIIAGERRFRAARLAGLEEVPVIVRDWDEQKRMEAALIENLQRSDLNPIEEAEGIRRLMDESSLTQDKAAERLGMSRPAVANLLRLMTLPEAVIQMLRDGRLSAGHGRALVTVDKSRQIQLANLASSQHWSVRQLEKVCSTPQKVDEKPASVPDQQLVRLEHMARSVFGTRVKLDGDLSSGRITLSYYSRDDLQRIWDIIESVSGGDGV